MESILIDSETRAVVQGITGKVGRAQTHWMVKAGELLVAGVTPGKGGQEVEGLPVYNSVQEAVENQDVNTSVIFVPPLGVLDAVIEAIEALKEAGAKIAGSPEQIPVMLKELLGGNDT